MLKFFLFGFVLDVLITLYTKRIVSRRALQAGGLAVLITFLNLYVYNLIITEDLILAGGVMFALGCGCGTATITKFVK